jgi:AcrR family transcriptional regulator
MVNDAMAMARTVAEMAGRVSVIKQARRGSWKSTFDEQLDFETAKQSQLQQHPDSPRPPPHFARSVPRCGRIVRRRRKNVADAMYAKCFRNVNPTLLTTATEDLAAIEGAGLPLYTCTVRVYGTCVMQHTPGGTGRGSHESTERRASREAVIAAGLRLVDSDGAAGLSMRRVADQVGVPVMTLYGFVRTKRELVEAVSERAFEGLFKSERREGAWTEQLRALTEELHGALRDHPGVVELILTDSVPSGIFDDVREAMLAFLHDAGLDQADSLQALGGLFSLTLGFAVAAAARTRSAQRSSDEVARLQHLHPADYPRLAQVTADYPSHLSHASFTNNVEHLIAAWVPAQRTTKTRRATR